MCMETLVLDRKTKTLPKRTAPVLAPAAETIEVNPDGVYINPDDYPDTTAYLNAIPGMADMLIQSKNLPNSSFEEWV